MANQRRNETITLIPEGDQEEMGRYGADSGAADVTMTNLEDEIRQTEGLSVTVCKAVGGPNKPMQHCFRQMASNFPMLDDLKEYTQKHFGAGDYRAFYRVGSLIKYNIPFSLAADAFPAAQAPIAAPAGGSDLAQVLAVINESNARSEARMQQLIETLRAPQADPFALVERTMNMIKPLLPAPGAAPVAGGTDLLSGLKQMMEVKELLLSDLKPNSEERPWWVDVAKEVAVGVGPALAGLIAAAKERSRLAGAASPRDVTPAAPALPNTENGAAPVTANDPLTVAREVLVPYKGALLQLQQAASFGAEPAKCAGAVLDETPEPGLMVLENLTKPENRDAALTVVMELVPGAEGKREWWQQFLAAIHADLQEEPLTPETPAPTMQ